MMKFEYNKEHYILAALQIIIIISKFIIFFGFAVLLLIGITVYLPSGGKVKAISELKWQKKVVRYTLKVRYHFFT